MQEAGWGTLPEKNVDLSVSGGGGDLGWEDTCAPVADSCQYMAKTTIL